MKNWIHTPSHPDIARYVECYWFIDRDRAGQNADFPKLNPDPSAHLIFAPAAQRYYYHAGSKEMQGQGSHWLYPHVRTLIMDHSRDFQIAAVKFHPGALYALGLDVDAPRLDDTQVVTSDTLPLHQPIEADALVARAAAEPDAFFAQMEHLLLPWFARAQADKHSKLTSAALPLLLDTPVGELGDKLYCSQRTLERSFARVTGLTLKQYQSMVRLDTLLEALYQQAEADIDWAAIAVQFGFSDQPHLIRYLKRTLGTTPGKYAKQRDFTIDIYGDFERS
ncbi:helix-turn-helix domain-containing protein [Ferrimonas pelagia]|uniref:Helix-turn-helix domain-containing protein n=1 Tax=Ferrimonas pelagia TaxID=1177826 RepID=A0ABP9EYZ1_9GAMM